MRDGFVKVAAGTPKIRVADCRYNAEQIFTLMAEAAAQGVRVLCLPELCLTGYTCGTCFCRTPFERRRGGAVHHSGGHQKSGHGHGTGDASGINNKLYNCAPYTQRRGTGILPKTHLPNYGNFTRSGVPPWGRGFAGVRW
jgi:NAD+ synthase (glutamine-hydrolysing)